MRMFRLFAASGALFALVAGCTASLPPASEASGPPVAARTVTYQCEGGSLLTVTYADNFATFTDAQGQTHRLAQQVTGSGFEYSGAGHDLRGKGDELMWTVNGSTLTCNAGRAMATPPTTLAGTKWQLVQFQSPEDSIGTIKPSDPSAYTMELMPGGQLAMRLDCNRATGHWEAQPASPTDGHISFNAPAMTRAFCGEASMDTRIARDLEFVTSYRLIGDTLNLALKMDSGIYTWRRIP